MGRLLVGQVRRPWTTYEYLHQDSETLAPDSCAFFLCEPVTFSEGEGSRRSQYMVTLTAVRRSGVPVRGGVETGVTAQECSCRCVFRRLSQWCSSVETVLSGLVEVVVVGGGVVCSCHVWW